MQPAEDTTTVPQQAAQNLFREKTHAEPEHDTIQKNVHRRGRDVGGIFHDAKRRPRRRSRRTQL